MMYVKLLALTLIFSIYPFYSKVFSQINLSMEVIDVHIFEKSVSKGKLVSHNYIVDECSVRGILIQTNEVKFPDIYKFKKKYYFKWTSLGNSYAIVANNFSELISYLVKFGHIAYADLDEGSSPNYPFENFIKSTTDLGQLSQKSILRIAQFFPAVLSLGESSDSINETRDKFSRVYFKTMSQGSGNEYTHIRKVKDLVVVLFMLKYGVDTHNWILYYDDDMRTFWVTDQTTDLEKIDGREFWLNYFLKTTTNNPSSLVIEIVL